MDTIHIIATFLLALIIGGMFFFAAIMTPLVFTKLPPETSGPFIRQAFPVYSQAMAGMTILTAALLFKSAEAIHLSVVFVLFLWAWLWLTPRINRYRDAQLQGDENAEKAFNLLHRLSVGINLMQMLAIGNVLYRVVTQS